MKGVRKLRDQHIIAANALSARPNIRQIFASQANAASPADFLAGDLGSIPSIQAPDGKFLFMLGYSRPGDGDVLG